MFWSVLKIIRPVNLLLIALAQGLIKFTLFEAFEIPLALDNFGFLLLTFSSVCIAAGGNVINDLYDVKIDAINKPHKVIVGKTLSEEAANYLYVTLTTLGVSSGFWVSNIVGKPSLAIIFIAIAALLYWYATGLKSILLKGNLIISLLVALSLLIVVLFDIYPVLRQDSNSIYFALSRVVFNYAVCAFYLNFMREIIKDIQDINGDKNGGKNTLAIVLGISRTKIIVFALGVFALFMLLLSCYHYFYEYQWPLIYFIFLIGGPLLFFCIKIFQAEKPKQFFFPSLLLKIIMLLGVGSLSFIKILIA